MDEPKLLFLTGFLHHLSNKMKRGKFKSNPTSQILWDRNTIVKDAIITLTCPDCNTTYETHEDEPPTQFNKYSFFKSPIKGEYLLRCKCGKNYAYYPNTKVLTILTGFRVKRNR
jgi:hypothetical protein